MRGSLARGGAVSVPWWRLAGTDRITSIGLAVSVGLLFGVSGGMLWLFGYNYDGLTGSPLTKIHPSSYLIIFLLLRATLRSGNPFGYWFDFVNRRPAALLMALAASLLFVVIAIRRGPGMAGTIDTFLIPALLVLLTSGTDEKTLARMETVLHVLMTANALLALAEFATGVQLFPYRFDGVLLVGDTRASALQGHPLENAFITSCYVLALLTGGRSLPPRLLPILIILQCAALVAFGGRSAIVVTLLLGGAYLIHLMLRRLRSGRVSLREAAACILGLALTPALISWLAEVDFFNALLERFVSDSGSAHSRVVMFEMFKTIPLRDLIIGPSLEHVQSLRRIFGLKSGIENPFLSMTLYHGALLTVLTLGAMALMIYEIARRSVRGCWLPILAFAILINTFESVATKGTSLTKFVIILLCLYRLRPSDFSFSYGADEARAP